MVGIVIVSHSAAVADGVVELAREMAGEDVVVEAAGGLDEPGRPLGTDATLVLSAIERAGAGGDVLVLMDLGSAVLSAETALDLRADPERPRVLLCEAPLVEGAVAAAAAARLGRSLEEVATEARAGLIGKAAHLGVAPAPPPPAPEADEDGPWRAVRAPVGGAHGLHARPAAQIVRAAGALEAQVQVANLTAGRGPADARSLTALSALGALPGHEVEIRARGRDQDAALEAVAALVRGEGDGAGPAPPRPQPPAAPPSAGEELRGVAASPGQALGPARVAVRGAPRPDQAPAGDPRHEREALDAALAAVAAELRGLRDAVAGRAGPGEAAILDAQALLVEDPGLVDPVREAVAGGRSAAAAWDDAVTSALEGYSRLDDAYLRARGRDLGEVGDRVLARLAGGPGGEAVPAAPGILVAHELGAAQTAALDPALTLGLAGAAGGATSHSSILARSLGLPAVVGLGDRLLAVPEGTPLLVDGDAGVVVVAPAPERAAGVRAARREREGLERAARGRAHEPALTADGLVVEVEANVGGLDDVAAAVEAGADGVGLLRSEFLFLGRAEPPGEAAQRAVYAAAAELLAGRRLVLRTLDAGGDKPLPFLGLPSEENPALGLRGVRLSLARPDLLAVQLRAALSVAAEAPLAIMFPMVAGVPELRAARRVLEEVAAELPGGLPAGLEIGVMVEVPSAALLADRLAEEVDFLSVGTNDLTQYTMAAERGNAGVASLADHLEPAVLRLLARVVEAGAARGRRVGVCGEAASDPAAVPVLVGLGVRELSAHPRAVPLVKQAVRGIDAGEARELARRALDQDDAGAVRALVRAWAGERRG